ncbi:MAG: hypothetical protein JXX29_07765 [Deltaproteobacteria bacterium]|nr:hypothetical protein [Deltaproteobacteria bacterium]MBN2671554.1 hypothetical protein [Deltaproteobacteria bacterium]
MKRGTMVGIALLVAMTIGRQGAADQFSAEIEAQITGTDNTKKSSASNTDASETATDEDGFLSEEKKKTDEVNTPFWLAIGPQLGMGPNILFPPKNASNVGTTDAAPFEDGGGGIGGGGGALIATRFKQGKLGLDLGIFAERNQTRTNMTVNGYNNNKFIYKYSIVRMPLLFKLYRLKELQRFSLGIGPELIVGLDSTKGEIHSDEVLQTVLRVEPQIDLAGAVDLGWAIKFNKWLVGLDLKITYNITGPREYSDRVYEASGGFEVVASHSLDARILVNMMYEIGLGAD